MSMAWDHYREVMSEFNDESPYTRPHLADCGYEYEDGYWFAVFVDKEVVARKDHPKFGIVKGQKHRFIKTKYICDETGCNSWEVQRIALTKPKPKPVFEPAYSSGWSNPTKSSWTGSWNTDAWTRKDK